MSAGVVHPHLPNIEAMHIQPPPLILNTAATPPPPPTAGEPTPNLTTEPRSDETVNSKRPSLSVSGSADGIKRAVSGLFRRTGSHGSNGSHGMSTQRVPPIDGMSHIDSSDPSSIKGTSHLLVRRLSATHSASSSADVSLSNIPPSPGLAKNPLVDSTQRVQVQEPSQDAFGFIKRKNGRSPSGLHIRDKFSKSKIMQDKVSQRDTLPQRSNSFNLDNQFRDSGQPKTHGELPPRQVWGMVPDTGTGLKARRMSLSLPDDFFVDVVDLYSEYSDQSKIVGRRGKNIGKGSTANVRLMNGRGSSAGEVFAVKEFRGKSTTEKAEDYEKKIKSEYSIAKSVHHPNIVETLSLCTYNGRWIHVMKFCEQGDLFNLVSQKYLAREDRLADRLCLFKQLIQGLNYLHNNGIAHRDVKLENLLITKHSKLKITDFGVSEVFCGIHPGLRSACGQCGKEMGEIRLCAPGMCGSPPYVAPEVIAKQGEYDPRPLDVWGAAIVMLCMTANGVLWPEAKAGSSPLYDDLIRGWAKWNAKHISPVTPSSSSPSTSASTLEPFPAAVPALITETDYPHVSFFDSHINPPALRRMLLSMLNPDPHKRVSINSIAKNRWMRLVECCQVDGYENPTIVIDAKKGAVVDDGKGKMKAFGKGLSGVTKVVCHNHLPGRRHLGHGLVRLPGGTD